VTDSPVRWGFIGAGFIASTALAPATHRAHGAELYAVASRDAERSRLLEPTRVHQSYRDLVDDPFVEAVYISLTNDQHLPWVLAALEAGKPVLCEKPLTLDAAQCRKAFAAADSAGQLLVEATWMRWHPRHRRASELLAAGASGPIASVDATFTFGGVPTSNYRRDGALGGGALLDLGPYVLAPAVDWCQQDWKVDTAEATFTASGADLRTSAHLQGGDAEASLFVSIDDPEQQRLRVAASDLTVSWETEPFTNWQAPSGLTLTDDTTEWTEAFEPCDAYQLMVEQVSRRIRGDDDAFIPDSSLSVRTAELIDLVRSETGETS
jgi:predicted dehydrogenase